MPQRPTGSARRGHAGPGSRGGLLPLVAVAALALSTACRTGSPEAGSRAAATPAVEGCWELEVTAEGAERDSVRTWLPAGELPYMVELDAARREAAGEEWYAAYSWFDGRRETAPFSVWRRIPGDSILVQRAGALAGLALRLTRSGDELLGNLVGFTDVRTLGNAQSSRREAPVRGTATACP